MGHPWQYHCILCVYSGSFLLSVRVLFLPDKPIFSVVSKNAMMPVIINLNIC